MARPGAVPVVPGAAVFAFDLLRGVVAGAVHRHGEWPGTRQLSRTRPRCRAA